MAGKRNWYVVRRQLLQAAHGCKARGDGLGNVLFVPETFRLDDRTRSPGAGTASCSWPAPRRMRS
jgi:hypothetical protein